MRRILGFDPGLANVGFAVLKSNNPLQIEIEDVGAITTSSSDLLHMRLADIQTRVQELIDTWQPDIICCESIFINANKKSVMGVAMALGVLCCSAGAKGLQYKEYSPLQIKKAITGSGRAPKEQLLKVFCHLLPSIAHVKNHHAVDAAAVAYCHFQMDKLNRLIPSC